MRIIERIFGLVYAAGSILYIIALLIILAIIIFFLYIVIYASVS